MKRKVAVLGGGASGQMFAADLSLAGWEVHLFELPEFERGIEDVIATRKTEIVGNQFNSKGFKRDGIADIDTVTTNMAEALSGVELINVCVPSIGHKAFFEKMIPHLKDGQTISIFPDNFGSLVFRRMLRERNVDVAIIVGGWDTMPGAFRLIEPGKVDCLSRAVELRGDTLPSKDWDDFLKVMGNFPLFDPVEIVHGDTVIDVGLSNYNPVVHCVGTLLSIGAMENASPQSFDLYRDGLSPSIAKAIVAFYHEECLIADTLGVSIERHDDAGFTARIPYLVLRTYLGKESRGMKIGFDQKLPMENPTGPFSIESRYLTEDIPIGTCARYSLARHFDIEVPVIESIIRLASVICGRDFMKECRSMEEMGLGGMARDEILRYLREGKI